MSALHQTAGFSAGAQLNKGTATDDNFIRGRMATSAAQPRYTDSERAGQHTGVHQRPTSVQSRSVRTAFIADWRAQFPLYPYLFGYMLKSVGFGCVSVAGYDITITATGGTYTLTFNGQTTGAIAFDANAATVQTALEALSNVNAGDVAVSGTDPLHVQFHVAISAFTVDDALATGGTVTVATNSTFGHVFTLANADALEWISIIAALGEGANRWPHLLRDARGSQVQIQADRSGVTVNASGLAIASAPAAGTETHTQEPDVELSPSTGSFTLTSSDVTPATVGTPRGHTFTIDNPQSEDELDLHTFERGDLPPTGLAITGTLDGLSWSEEAFREWTYGSAAGTAPVDAIPYGSLAWLWETTRKIGATDIPYSWEVDIETVEMIMQPFEVTGGGQILYQVNYRMIDNVAADPIRIIGISDLASYAGS